MLRSRKYRVMMALCAFLGFYQLSWKIRQKIRRLPPGPSPLMLLYYLAKMFILKRRFDVIYINKELAKSYGRKGLWYQALIGHGLNMIKITSSSIAKQILNNKLAYGRPIFGGKHFEAHIEHTADGTAPFANLNGKEWEKRRKLSQSILFRMCTSKFVTKILDERMQSVVFPELNKLSKTQQLWYPSSLMKYCAFNTVFYANFGCNISYNDPLYHQFVQVITETFALFESGIIFSLVSKPILFLIKLNPYSNYYRIIDLIQRRSEIYQGFTKLSHNSHKKTDKDEIYYIDYIQNELTESQVEADASSLFGAGTDTTSSALDFAIIFCAKYPNIQRKVRDELIKCYNKNSNNKSNGVGVKTFDINWINKLVYFRAFIYEVLRVSSVVQIGLPHCAQKDILVTMEDNKQCIIPKGTVIAYIIELIHKNNDKEHWIDSSDNMCLENWINIDNKFELNQSFMTFGTGRRNCVGKSLAMKELYIIMTYLLLNYTFAFKDKNDISKPIKTLWNGVNIIDPPVGVIVNRL